MNFCTNCGGKLSGGRFCGNCGNPVVLPQPTQQQSEPRENAGWTTVRSLLDKNWGGAVEIEPSVFDTFSTDDWKSLQHFLQAKSSHFLGLRTLEEHNYWIAETAKNPFRALDTIETFEESLSSYIRSIDPASQTSQLICAIGTRAQLPYGAPNSGASYYEPDAMNHTSDELATLTDVLRLGHEDNLIGENFDPYIAELDLLSDFGRSFVVPFLGETRQELDLLVRWGPSVGKFSFDMTSVLIVGMHSGRLRLPRNLFLNPRMIHMLIDADNHSLPWWMEMSMWYSCAKMWKQKSEHEVGALDLQALGDYLGAFLAGERDYAGAEQLFQDVDLFHGLLRILRD